MLLITNQSNCRTAPFAFFEASPFQQQKVGKVRRVGLALSALMCMVWYYTI